MIRQGIPRMVAGRAEHVWEGGARTVRPGRLGIVNMGLLWSPHCIVVV